MDVTIFKYLSTIIYNVSFIVAIFSGYVLYTALSSRTEKIQTRLRFKRTIKQQKELYITNVTKSNLEVTFKRAGYPMKLNAIRYLLIRNGLLLILIVNYIILPILSGTDYSIWSMLGIIAYYLASSPSIPYSLPKYLLKKMLEYRISKMNSEIFTFHDLLIGEIEMMTNTRINTYNIIRHLKPYFKEISPLISKLLSSWNKDTGPDKALDEFAEELSSNEAKSLVSVLKTLDMNERDTALKALKGMNDLFIRSQIENYRRRRKFIADIFSIPIKIGVFLILLNFLLIVVYMVSIILENSSI